MLQEAAATRNVRMVVVSIGGNDFEFASVVQSCVVNFLTSPSWWKNYCHDDDSVEENFTAANVAAVRSRVVGALSNVATAMSNAGYSTSQWTLVVQTYPSPVPSGSGFRYSESGYTRQSTGGCGLWNRDADWANATALPTINGALLRAAADVGLPNVRTLDMTHAFDGKRLCENGVGLYEEVGLPGWQSPAPSTAPSGSTRSARSPRSATAPTTCRSRCTPATGDSSRCATACARSGTAVPPAAEAAPWATSGRPDSRRRASRR